MGRRFIRPSVTLGAGDIYGAFGINPRGSQVSYPFVFTPATISGLIWWLDANDDPTVIVDGSNRVLEWHDKSSSSFDITPAATGPQYVGGALNGKPALRFNASEHLQRAPVIQDKPATIFVVASHDNVTQSYTFFSQGNLSSSSIYCNIWSVTGVPRATLRGGGSPVDATVAVTIASGDAGIYMGRFYPGRQFLIEYDGTAGGLTGAAIAITGTATTLGCNARSVLDGKLNGDIYEVIVYNAILASSEEDQIVDYLSDKWGLGL